jgi:hypothetical protein
MASMYFDFGLEKDTVCFKQKFRWLLKIPDVSASGVNSLPPSKAARPSLSFKTMEIQHLNETIFRPSKPDWKPINLTLFDLKKNEHPIFKWLKKQYDPENGEWKNAPPNDFVISEVTLEMYDGCGSVMETWIFENVWPETVEFGDLDMALSDYSTCELSLRYDRAYIVT